MLKKFASFYDRHRSILNRIPGINRLPQLMRRAQRRQLIREKGTNKNVFTHIYANNLWNAESASGPGSTHKETECLRQELPALISKLQVHTILDAPCGDYHWFRKISFPHSLTYIGGDIVDELIARNRERYGSDGVRFQILDITSDLLPASDIWLCRDCWIHFSAEDILKSVRNFLQSDISHLLATTFTNCTNNAAILTGEFRPINLMLAPFFFPEPLLSLDDPINKYPDKKLGLWSRDMLQAALSQIL